MPHQRSLRSASTEQLHVPTYRRSTVGGRAFPVAGAKVWDGLPSDVTSASSLSVFKNRLKTYSSAAATKLFDFELHYLFLVIMSSREQRSLQEFLLFRPPSNVYDDDDDDDWSCAKSSVTSHRRHIRHIVTLDYCALYIYSYLLTYIPELAIQTLQRNRSQAPIGVTTSHQCYGSPSARCV